MAARQVRLGLRENVAQFSLLVAVTAFAGAMVGLERSALPLLGREDFGLDSNAAVLSFIVAFGLVKALANLGAGALAERVGRRRLLIAGWAVALPVPLLIAVAPSWTWIVAANVLLGANQGLAWSMTVVMKIDLVGPQRRGLALGLNEAAGYGGLALAAGLSGLLAAEYAARDVLVVAGAAIAALAFLLSVLLVRDTGAHVELEQTGHRGAEGAGLRLREAFARATYRVPALRSASQAGLVNNLNDGLAWGLVPLFLAAHGAGLAEVGLVAGIYPGVWSVAQIGAGHWSDSIGRKPPIVAGMFVQAAALVLLALSGGAIPVAAGAAALLGLGTALVYPTLIAAISDSVSPVARAPVVGVYRFWRDMGYALGALIAGAAADALGYGGAIAFVAGLTGASGLWVLIDMPAAPRYPRTSLPSVDVHSEIEIARPRAEVAAYACDPGNATAWYENIEAVRWESPMQPVAVGSRFAFVARFLGRRLAYTYEVRELVPSERFVMATAEGPFPMETTYLWEDATDGHTRMTLRNRGEPSGFARLSAPILAGAMRRANRKDLRRLKQILERDDQPARRPATTGAKRGGDLSSAR